MFEQGLAFLLKKLLGEFVEGGEKIQVGVSGHIVLENLVLKNSILSLVDVPIALSYGSIGKFELTVPWTSLGVDPVVIVIERVNILVQPKYEWNPGAADKKEQAIKRAKLAAAELFATNRLANKAGNSYTDFAKNWFITSFINKIIDNIQITVKDVHFRYEDEVSCPSMFCIGMSFESLKVQTRDSSVSFEEKYHGAKGSDGNSYDQYSINTTGCDSFFKLVEMKNLAVYWNPLVNGGLDVCSCNFVGRPQHDIKTFMERTIVKQYIDRPRHHYILFPVDMHTHLDISFNVGTAVTKVNMKMHMSSLAIALEDRQFREILAMATNAASYEKLGRFSEFRPDTINDKEGRNTVMNNPAAWWRYAINAVLIQIRLENKKRMTFSKLTMRAHDKLVYVELWKSKLVSPQSVLSQFSAFDALEKRTLDRDKSEYYKAMLRQGRENAARASEAKRAAGPEVKAVGKGRVSATFNSKLLHKNGHGDSVVAKTHKDSAPDKKTPQTKPLTNEGVELLKTMEYVLSFEDIVQFRSKAESSLTKEAKQTSWLSSISSWVTGDRAGSLDEKDKLFEALKYDPDRVFRGGSKEVDQNEVIANVTVSLKKGSVTLALSTPEVNTFQSSLPFLKIELNDLRSKNIIMGDGGHVKVFVSLQDFEAFEVISTTSKTSRFTSDVINKKFVFRRTFAHEHQQSDFFGGSVSGSVYDDNRSVISASVKSAKSARSPKTSSVRGGSSHNVLQATPLFTSAIEIFPSNKEMDTSVNLVLEELEVWVSPFATWIDPMTAFVSWPAELEYWSVMEMKALNQLADFKSRLDAKLEYMMNNHSNIVIEAKVKAPVIIVTDSASHDDKADVLVVDLGLITLKTEKLAKAQRQKNLDAANTTGGFNSDANSSVRMPSHQTTPNSVRHRKTGKSGNLLSSAFKNAVPPIAEESSQPLSDSTIVGVEMDLHGKYGYELVEGHQDGLNSSRVEELESDDEEQEHFIQSQEERLRKGGLKTPFKTPAKTPAKVEVNRNLDTSSSDYNGLHQDSELGGLNFLQDSQDEYGFKDHPSTARRSSVYHRYAGEAEPSDSALNVSNSYYGNPVTPFKTQQLDSGAAEGENNLSEDDLFDVFVCRVKDSEVYLISSAMVHNLAAEDVDPNKTVIVDRNEMVIEIQVSVLPWDTTLPPVKLFVEMEELTVQLSEFKLKRLNQFAVGLVNRSNLLINSNKDSINRISNAIKRRSLESASAKMRSSTGSLGGGGAYNLSSRLSTGSTFRAQRASQMRSQVNSVLGDDNLFYDAKSDMGGVSFKNDATSDRMSVSSSRLRKLVEGGKSVVSDGESDDDSFFSVDEEHADRDRVRQEDNLANEISQRVTTRDKLFSDIRVAESDPSKTAVRDVLRQDLRVCEDELRQFRERYLQLRMHTVEIQGLTNEGQAAELTEEERTARNEVADQLIFPGGAGHVEDLRHKRNLIHASVFKISQEPNQYSNADVKFAPENKLSEFANKKLVYVKVNIAVINVDLLCVSEEEVQMPSADRRDGRSSRMSGVPSMSMPLLRSIVFRLKLSGLHLTLKHKTMDSKVLFVLHQLDLQDYSVFSSNGAASLVNGLMGGDKPHSYRSSASFNNNDVYLVSSEPATFGMFALPLSDRYLQAGHSDLLKVKYDVVYPDVQPASSAENYSSSASHNVHVTSGFLGLNIDQEKISTLIATATSIAKVLSTVVQEEKQQAPSLATSNSVLQPTASVAKAVVSSPDDHNESVDVDPPVDETFCIAKAADNTFDEEKLPVPTTSSSFVLQQLPNIALTFSMDCVSVSLLCRSEPLVTASVWAISASAGSIANHMTSAFRVTDLTVDYQAPGSELQAQSIFCRQGGVVPLPPFVSLDVTFDLDEEHVYMPNLRVSLATAPMALTVNLDCIHDVSNHVANGPVAKLVKTLSAKSTNDGPSLSSAVPPPPVPSNSSGSILDSALNPLLDLCNGTVTVRIGGVALTAPSVGADLQHDSDIVASFLKVESSTLWGDCCATGGLESSLMLHGAEVKLSDMSVVDPLDVCVLAVMMPQTVLAPFGASTTTTKSSLTFPTKFLPPSMARISKNEVQVSVSVSPVLLRCHDRILAEASAWVRNTHAIFSRIGDVFAAESVPAAADHKLMDAILRRVSCNSGAPSNSDSSLTLGFALNFSLLMYEMVCSVEVCDEHVDAAPKRPSRDFDDHFSGSQPHQRTPLRSPNPSRGTPQRNSRGNANNMQKPASFHSAFTFDSQTGPARSSAVVRLVSRNIALTAGVEDCMTSELSQVADPDLLFALHSLEVDCDTDQHSFLELQLSVDSVDLEHMAPDKPFKRLMCNLQHGALSDQKPHSESFFSQQGSLVLSRSSSDSEDNDAQPNPKAPLSKFMILSVDVSSLLDVSVDILLSNIQVAVLSDAAVALMVVAKVYETALSGPSAEEKVIRGHVGDNGSVADNSSVYGGSVRGPARSHHQPAVNGQSQSARPSSVPMSTSDDPERSASFAVKMAAASAEAAQLPISLLDSQSFSLPAPLKSFKIKLTVVNVQTWVPVWSLGGGDWSLCSSIGEISLEAAHHRVSVGIPNSEQQEFWSSHCSVTAISACLSDSVSHIISTPVPELTLDQCRDGGYQPMHRENKKVLLAPFDVKVRHSISVSPYGRPAAESSAELLPAVVLRKGSVHLTTASEYELTQQVEVSVQNIDVHLLLDYRPYLRMYEYVSAPFTKYFAINTGSNGSTSVPAKVVGGLSAAAQHVAEQEKQMEKQNTDPQSPMRISRPRLLSVDRIERTPIDNTDTEPLTLSGLAADDQLRRIHSVVDLFANLLSLSSLSLSLSQDAITVYVVNDIHMQEPVSIARLAVRDFDVSVRMEKPLRTSCVVVLDNEQTAHDIVADGQQFQPISRSNSSSPATHAKRSSNYLDLGSSLIAQTPLSLVQEAFKENFLGKPATSEADMPKAIQRSLLTVAARFSTRVDYFNQKLIASEPLVEPFGTQIVFTLPHSDASVAGLNRPIVMLRDTTNVGIANEHALEASLCSVLVDNSLTLKPAAEDASSTTHQQVLSSPPCLQLSTTGHMDVNVTAALFEVAFLTAKSLASIDPSTPATSAAHKGSMSLLGLRNDSGLHLQYWTKHRTNAQEVPANCEVPLNLNADSSSAFTGNCWLARESASAARSLHVALMRPTGEFYPSLLDVSLEGDGCRLYVLDSEAADAKDKKHSSVKGTVSAAKVSSQLSASLRAPNNTVVALELVSRAGIKTLLVRSTMRLVNTTKIAFKVELVCGYRNSKRDVLWEALVSAGSQLAVPAHLCNVDTGRFIVKPVFVMPKHGQNSTQWTQQYHRVSNQQRHDVFSAELPVPGICGVTVSASSRDSDRHGSFAESDEQEGDFQDGSQYHFNERSDSLPRNFLMWRKQSHQKKGVVESLAYSHWVHFNKNNSKSTDSVYKESWDLFSFCQERAEAMCCNVDVVSKGLPQLSKSHSADNCMLRTLTFASSITLTNLTAHGIEVAIAPNLAKHTGNKFETLDSLFKANRHLVNVIPTATLKSGEAWDCVSYHSSEHIQLSLKLTHDVSSNDRQWSAFVHLPGCRRESTGTSTFFVNVAYRNGSTLQVQVDVEDRDGSRAVSIYVPYWVVSSSALPLLYQHESPIGSTMLLNGTDGLAADQALEVAKATKSSVSGSAAHRTNGLGNSRGVNGVVLGPGAPMKGLAGVLSPAHSNVLSRFSLKRQEQAAPPVAMLQKYISSSSGALTTTDTCSVNSDNASATSHYQPPSGVEPSYRLMQCGYTNPDARTASLRIRTKTSDWSKKAFGLDKLGVSETDLHTVTEAAPSDSTGSSEKPKEVKQQFPFGVWTSVAEAPFQRTKIVVVVDRVLLVNSVGQSLEVKQFAQETVFKLGVAEEVPMWWMSNVQTLQVRLNRFGWNWSGKFSVDKEGEIPIRLRNEYDNTVFFVLVEVQRKGPRVCVIFKGGEQFSPYRFENHTLETFRIRQKGQTAVTTLLPYHCSAYAWDEPLCEHQFSVDMSKNAAHSQDEWTTLGTFSFDRLETIERKTKDHLVLKVVAQGPTRVLQISDSRTALRPKTNKSPQKKRRNSTAALLEPQVAVSTVKPVLFQVLVNIAAVGVSIVDHTPQELLYISMANSSVSVSVGDGFFSCALDLERLQVDNQLWSTPFPSMFYPLLPSAAPDINATSPSRDRSGSIVPASDAKFLSLFVSQDFQYPGVIFLSQMKLALSPFDLNVEFGVVTKLYAMAMHVVGALQETSGGNAVSRLVNSNESLGGMSRHPAESVSYVLTGKPPSAEKHVSLNLVSPNTVNSLRSSEQKTRSSLPHTKIRKMLSSIGTAKEVVHKPSPKIYVQAGEVSAIRMNLSVNPSALVSLNMIENFLVVKVLAHVLLSLGSSFAKIDNCPIKLYLFSMKHVYCSDKELVELLSSNYMGQMITQSATLALSSELIGNPRLLVSTMAQGLSDFVTMPYNALSKSPQAVAYGLYAGTSSLLRRSVASVCTTAAHVISAVQVGMLTLGVVEPSAVTSKAAPLAITASSSSEAEETETSLVLVDRPTRNYSPTALSLPNTLFSGVRFGLQQFRPDIRAGHVVKGLFGLLSRPVYGALGQVSNALNKFSFQLLPRMESSQKRRLQRSRPPRFLHSPNLPLQVYSADENAGTELLLRVHKGEYRNEVCLFYGRLSGGHKLLVTRVRVMVVNDSFEFCELLWQCLLRNVLSAEVHYPKTSSQDAVANTLKLVGLAAETKQTGPPLTKTSEWKCNLPGEPSLHLYYRPTASSGDHSSQSDREPAGLRFAQKVMHLSSHEQLLLLLNQLVRLNSALLSHDIVAYLSEAVQDDSLVRALLKDCGGSTAASRPSVLLGHRSPNRKIISNLGSFSPSKENASPRPFRSGAPQYASASSLNSAANTNDATVTELLED